jgi:hypothetical protein
MFYTIGHASIHRESRFLTSKVTKRFTREVTLSYTGGHADYIRGHGSVTPKVTTLSLNLETWCAVAKRPLFTAESVCSYIRSHYPLSFHLVCANILNVWRKYNRAHCGRVEEKRYKLRAKPRQGYPCAVACVR